MSHPQIAVSVIIPVYNGEENIRHLVECVLAETRVKLELIVINDGSTDNTRAILNSIQDERLVVIEQANGGVSAARNTGLAVCRGKWLILLDADDIISPDMIVNRYTRAEQHNCDVLVCNGWCGGPGDNLTGAEVHKHQIYNRTISGFEWIKHAVSIREWPHYVWLQMINSEYIKENKVKFHKDISHEDILWCTELALANGRFYFSPEADYYYLKNTSSVTNHDRYYDPRAYSYIDIIKKLIHYARLPKYAAVSRPLYIHALRETGHFSGLYRKKIKDRPAVRKAFHENIHFTDLAKGICGIHEAWFLLRLWLRLR
ncbi:glycosyltransferase [Buttiauxella warmboldiae]|uniref:Glycosyltransferase n=1 Tax=Buttiauxella warmboldiae TaxID=82993 RepID=A0A3N5E779_9ENTR|nr:glycosyltransferase [Buttiauxella warmboldiae]RPH31089.1 glycosyltransferase [Buttiauxella warmboldiae]